MMMDTERVLLAAAFATEAHEGQSRKYEAQPYVLHVMRVARRVSVIPGAMTEDVLAAILHDTLEDCPERVTPDDIKNQFGQDVLDKVEWLTDPRAVVGGPNRAERKVARNKKFTIAPWQIKSIKCADVIDNLPSITTLAKLGFSQKYVNECLALFEALKGAEEGVYDELYGLLEWAKAFVEARQLENELNAEYA